MNFKSVLRQVDKRGSNTDRRRFIFMQMLILEKGLRAECGGVKRTEEEIEV